MNPAALLNHLANLAAPALLVALLVALFARVFMPNKAIVSAFWASVAINFIASLAVLVAGLWVYGNDGKMNTYAALVLVCASSQWLQGRPWRG